MDRDELKAECLRRLNNAGFEHSAGHQGKYAARYIVVGAGGEAVELMFEKGPKRAPNLWVAQRFATDLISNNDFTFRLSPAASLSKSTGVGQPVKYGRHSGLKPMKQLAHSDLVCFKIETLGQLDRILAHLCR